MILALDQGTTSSRAIVFDAMLKPLAMAQEEFPQIYPQQSWVEHDPEAIWQSVLNVAKKAAAGHKISAIGITNQRETCLIWDKHTGKPLYNAIVWQDRRTATHCETLKKQGLEPLIQAKTGLLLDPYFSATKLAWLLKQFPAKEILFGTIDTFLIWRLTQGRVHATDATNASRTMLYNIHTGEWDEELLKLFNIPREILPEIKDSADNYGTTTLFGGEIPILGVAGDQQAALIGQACFSPGMIKSTYGTGCFALLNTGEKAVKSQHKLLTTVAYQLKDKRTYALEGSIFIAGAGVQWLRDGLGVLKEAAEADARAALAASDSQVIVVPAFTGLGAPYWNAEARGAIFGLTRNSGANEITRATLEAVGYQTRDLIEAMQADWGKAFKTTLRVDGGMVASQFTMQFIADMLQANVEVPQFQETTARGAAYLAGLQAGILPAPQEFAKLWKAAKLFTPQNAFEAKYAGWQDAVQRVL